MLQISDEMLYIPGFSIDIKVDISVYQVPS
jgi:hypothetical protein